VIFELFGTAERGCGKTFILCAPRMPAARSKTHSRLPSGVVPNGTVIILGSDPALEALGYNTPPLPGLIRTSQLFSSPWVSYKAHPRQRGSMIFQRLTARVNLDYSSKSISQMSNGLRISGLDPISAILGTTQRCKKEILLGCRPSRAQVSF